MSVESSPEADLPHSGIPGVSLLADFDALNDGLTAVNEIVGRVFLGLSKTLQRVADQSRSVVELSTAAAKLAADSESEQYFQKLSNVVEITRTFEELAETSQQRLRNIHEKLCSSRNSLAALERIPPMLMTIGTLSRIESGRIDGTQVDTRALAVNITDLANKVDTNIGTISTHTTKLTQIVCSGVARVGSVADQERQRARAITNQTEGILKERNNNAQRTDRAIADIHERYMQIRSSIESMVVSLQAQDIARQRLEHVQQVLQQISASGMVGRQTDVAKVLVLQLSQVDSARDYIEQSITSVVSSLGSVSDQLNTVSAQTTTALSQVDGDGHSLDSGMKAALLGILTEVDRHRDSVRTTISIVKALVPWLTIIRQCVSELKQVESGIHQTALNARIETSHLGAEGAAMRALASELQTITEGSKGHIEDFLTSVAAIDTEIASLSEIRNRADDAEASTATNRRELDWLYKAVFRTNHVKTEKLEELMGETESLKSQLQGAIEQIVNNHNAREAFDNVHLELQRAIARLGGAGEISPDCAKQLGEEFATLYSMKSERDLHAQVLGRVEPSHQQLPATGIDEGLGDGIELF